MDATPDTIDEDLGGLHRGTTLSTSLPLMSLGMLHLATMNLHAAIHHVCWTHRMPSAADSGAACPKLSNTTLMPPPRIVTIEREMSLLAKIRRA